MRLETGGRARPRRVLLDRTHPHNAARNPTSTSENWSARAPSQSGGDRRGGARLSLRSLPARCAGGGLSIHIAAARDCAACRSSSTRERLTRTSPRFWKRERQGRFPRRSALLLLGPRLAETGLHLAITSRFRASSHSRIRGNPRHCACLPAGPSPGRDRCALSRAGAHARKDATSPLSSPTRPHGLRRCAAWTGARSRA